MKPALAGADGERHVMDLLITDSFGDSTDRNGNELVDDAMTPVLCDGNDKVTGPDALHHGNPCVLCQP